MCNSFKPPPTMVAHTVRSSRTAICNGAARRIPTCKRAFLQAIPIWALLMFAITRPNTRSLNVLLNDKTALALRSEHEVLLGALARHYTGKLGDLKETDEQRDITYLANKTAWDARAVALAALSDQFSARTRILLASPRRFRRHFSMRFFAPACPRTRIRSITPTPRRWKRCGRMRWSRE